MSPLAVLGGKLDDDPEMRSQAVMLSFNGSFVHGHWETALLGVYLVTFYQWTTPKLWVWVAFFCTNLNRQITECGSYR